MHHIRTQEFRERMLDILREVGERKAEYVITHDGEPVARLSPVDLKTIEAPTEPQVSNITPEDRWRAYTDLADRLRSSWPGKQPTQELMDAVRRE